MPLSSGTYKVQAKHQVLLDCPMMMFHFLNFIYQGKVVQSRSYIVADPLLHVIGFAEKSNCVGKESQFGVEFRDPQTKNPILIDGIFLFPLLSFLMSFTNRITSNQSCWS